MNRPPASLDAALDALVAHAEAFRALADGLRGNVPSAPRFHHVARVDVVGHWHTGPTDLTRTSEAVPLPEWGHEPHATAHQRVAAEAAHHAWTTQHPVHIAGMRAAVDALLEATLPRVLPEHAGPEHTLGVSITVGMMITLGVYWAPQAGARVGMGGPEHAFALPQHRAHARHLLTQAARLATQNSATRRWRVEASLRSVVGTPGLQSIATHVPARDATDALLCAALRGNNTLAHPDALHALAITEERRANAAEAARAALGPLASPKAFDHLAP